MKIIRYIIYVFICFTIFTYAGQPGNKVKKIPLPKGKQVTVKIVEDAAKSLISKINRTHKYDSQSKYSGSSLLRGVKGNSIIPYLNNPEDKSISKVIWDTEAGTPRLIEMQKVKLQKGNSTLSTQAATERAENFLLDKKYLLKISDPENEFILQNITKDDLGMTHIRYKQTYKGIEVWGRELYVHLDSYGNVQTLNGRYELSPKSLIDLNESITQSNAITISVNDLKNKRRMTGLPEQLKKILDYSEPTGKKIIWYDNNKLPHLAWKVEVRSGLLDYWFYFINAQTGEILNSYNNTCSDGPVTGSGVDLNGENRSFGTYQSGTTYFMIDASCPMFNSGESQIPDKPVGGIVNLDLRNSDLSNSSTVYYTTSGNNQWNDPVSISAHYNARVTYNYFKDSYNRNSIDDKGMTIYSIIHVTENGKAMENAFWSGKVMCYGDGGTYFKPLAGGLDVAAHEMTHGVTQYSANLEYQDQSGALNESMSDVFGTVVDNSNWQVGEQVIKDLSLFPTGAMRDMSNPHNGGTPNSASWQPAKMSEFVNTTKDNGGVHINSGIPNHAFYLAATSMGRDNAAKIWYRALNNYLTRTSQFIDARIATVKSAEDLFGASSQELQNVKNAWDGVEVFDGSGTPPTPPSQLVGDDWILVTNTDPNDPNSLYMAKSNLVSASDLAPLSTTPISNRPSVSDTSGIIFFIDSNNNLRVLYADPQNPQEQIFEGSGVWSSVAVGPGLNSLALTSIYIDSTIYYIYFDGSAYQTAQFKIATKSYDAADVNTALYADALSFDPTGKLLLFDAFNLLKSSTGDTLSFWNINLLDVSSGQMESVFPPLSENISVGNPAFSKTSSTRFALDYWDSDKNEDYVLAVDFNTGNIGNVAGPLRVSGYPSYSGDDKTIAFHTWITEGQFANREAVHQMPLKDNLIEGTGNAVPYLVDAKFPTWFVIGSRITGVQDKESSLPQTAELYQNYPNPFNPSTVISYQIIVTGQVSLKVYDVLGNEVAVLLNEVKEPGEYQISFDASKLPSGVYFYRLQTGKYNSTRKMMVVK